MTTPTIKPTYHLPPNFSTPPPPVGPFHLGTVIRSFHKREQMRPLTRSASSLLPIPKDQIYTDHKAGFTATRSRLQSGELGVWAKFLGLESLGLGGIGAEASLSAQRSGSDEFKFASVETEYFYPDGRYLKRCMEIDDVKDYLLGSNYKEPVFLVTGLKVAKGVEVSIDGKSKVEGNVSLGVESSPGGGGGDGGGDETGGMEIRAGPRLKGTSDSSNSYSFTESSDIVVGIQCVKLYYRSRWLGGEKRLKDELYTSGATFVEDGDEKPEEADGSGDYAVIVAEPEDDIPEGYMYQSQESWIVPER